ncbi:MAG: hypothetical protein FJW34_10205 [Acidobacteria bacterium]|nr:hypothetical protein [Acidobacteriota bacterium]
MLDTEAQTVPLPPPQAIYHSRVDDKGRLKVPRDFENYLRSLPDPHFFVTTLDERVARIYSRANWLENARLFEECHEDVDELEEVAFLTRVYGAESPLDKDGRILIPPQLRRKLGLENQPVWVGYFKGAVEVYSEAVYQEMMQRAPVNLKEKVKALRRRGLK